MVNQEDGMRKADVLSKPGENPPDDLYAAIMIYIERVLPPEDVVDWVI